MGMGSRVSTSVNWYLLPRTDGVSADMRRPMYYSPPSNIPHRYSLCVAVGVASMYLLRSL